MLNAVLFNECRETFCSDTGLVGTQDIAESSRWERAALVGHDRNERSVSLGIYFAVIVQGVASSAGAGCPTR